MLELAAEEFGARRVIEGEGAERVDHAPAPGMAPVEGLDADDRHHVFRRHAVGALGALQHLAMRLPERGAGVDAALLEERGAIVLPRAALLRRQLDRLQHWLDAPHA